MRAKRLLKAAFFTVAFLLLLLTAFMCKIAGDRAIAIKTQEAQNTVRIYGEKIRLQMLYTLNPTEELAVTALYADMDDPFWFNGVAGPLVERKDVRLVSLSNGDIITKTLPQTRQAAFIGRDIKQLSYVYTLAKVVGNLVIDGPVRMDLHPHDPDVFLYIKPIYDNEKYLGEIIVALDSSVVIEELNLDYFTQKGYDYELWHSEQQNGKKHIIAVSDSSVDFSDAVKTTIPLSTEWKLSIRPVSGWLSGSQKNVICSIGLFVTLLYMLLLFTLYQLIIYVYRLRTIALRDAQSGLYSEKGFLAALEKLFRSNAPVALCYFVFEGYTYYTHLMAKEEAERFIRDIPRRLKDGIHSPFFAGRLGDGNFIVAIRDSLTIEQIEDMAKGFSIELLLKTTVNGKHVFLTPRYQCVLPQKDETAGHAVRRTVEEYCQRHYKDSAVRRLTETCRRLANGQNDVEFEESTDPELMELSKVFNQYRKRVEQLAYNDPVFHVGNRLKFFRDTNLLISYNPKRPFSVFCVDVCKFSQYNQLFNAGVGDAVLAGITERLPRMFGDYLYRINGDVFLGILISGESNERFAARLREMLSRPFEIDCASLEINTRIIVCSYPANGRTPEELIERTEAALRYSKATGENTVICNEQLNSALREESSINLALNDSIHDESLEVWYQPICSLEDNSFKAVEALVRLADDNGGYYSAGRVVALAERSGFVESMGDYVLKKACLFMKEHGERLGLKYISVNVSVQQLVTLNSSGHLLDIIYECGLSPNKVMMEITETLLMQSMGTALVILEKLRESGVRIALDDFGTGYSSLYYLSNLPVDAIKIDRSLTQQFMQSEKQRMLVSAISQLADINGLNLIVEGVETGEELALLKGIGVTKVQGYYFAKPMPASKLIDFLKPDK